MEHINDESTFNSPPPMGWLFQTIVSGGQTGADRAALDWAISQNIAHGGWCPSGRMATDGPLASKYMLRETESTGYRLRTKLNVQDSDATLIFNSGVLDGGTLQTVRFAQKLNKPHRIFQIDGADLMLVAQEVASWQWQANSQYLILLVHAKKSGLEYTLWCFLP